MVLTLLVTLSIATVSFASNEVKRINLSSDKIPKGTTICGEIGSQTGAVEKLAFNEVKKWNFSSIIPDDKKNIRVFLFFKDFEDGTPVAVTLKDAKTGKSFGTWTGRLMEDTPARDIRFAVSSKKADYIMEIKHNGQDYLPFKVFPDVRDYSLQDAYINGEKCSFELYIDDMRFPY